MTGQMGAKIVDVLERVGEFYLGFESKVYQAFLLQVGGTDALRHYDATEVYWDRLQAVLDSFFTSAERARVCERLIERPELYARPEFRGFLCRIWPARWRLPARRAHPSTPQVLAGSTSADRPQIRSPLGPALG
jgi:hypothetical protein